MNTEPIRVLIIEDDADEAGIIGSYLADGAGAFALTQASRLSTACHLLARQEIDVVLIDLVLPQTFGLDGFQKIRALKPAMPVIVLTGLKDEALAIQAVKLGAQDYLIKGSPDCCLLKRCIRYAIEKKRLSNIIENLLGTHPPAESPKTASSYSLKELQGEAGDEPRAPGLKEHFVNRITHELRNSLAIIKTAAYCLKEGPAESLTSRQTRMVDLISRTVGRQARIIDNLLDEANFRSGKFNFKFRQTDVNEIIAETVQEFGVMGAAKQLHVEMDPGIPLIEGDPDLIAQVLRNLIANALDFAKHAVIIKASKADQEGVCVSISDDGGGIAPERLGALFTEFAPLDRPANADGHEGTGLGLTICDEIISGHNGKIWAESAPGQGARFCFVLPANGKPQKSAASNDRVLTESDSITND
jgi:DNA-binding NarL/FixJ family response regulator